MEPEVVSSRLTFHPIKEGRIERELVARSQSSFDVNKTGTEQTRPVQALLLYLKEFYKNMKCQRCEKTLSEGNKSGFCQRCLI